MRDLANTQDKYERLIKSGYYDEKRAERAEKNAEKGQEQQKELTPQERFQAIQERNRDKILERQQERQRQEKLLEREGHER